MKGKARTAILISTGAIRAKNPASPTSRLSLSKVPAGIYLIEMLLIRYVFRVVTPRESSRKG